MAHLALYRKYRSQTFSDLIGQEHIVRTLQNAIKSDRISHAYLFTGPRGTGKTSSARLLAKALCCEKGPTSEPCNECDICISITNGSCMDVIEMDAASDSGVDEVREKIVDVVSYMPAQCRYKVFIIDEVHDLSPKAFDALLKTVEEPPAHLIFVLATTEYNKVPPTIRSRCQKFEFHRGNLQDLVGRLDFVAKAEGIEVDPAAMLAIARMADGGYRDALTLLEQAIITSNGTVTSSHVQDQLGLISDELVDRILLSIRHGEVPGIIKAVGEVARMGRDPRALLESALHRLAELTRSVYGIEIGSLRDAPAEAVLHETATRLGTENLVKIRSALSEAHRVIRDVSLPRIWLESELIRIGLSLSEQTAPTQASQPVVKHTPAPTVAQPAATPSKSHVEPTKPKSQTKVSNSLWDTIYTDLSNTSKTLNMKLGSAKGSASESGLYVIEFERQMDMDWILERPKVQAAIREAVAKVIEPFTELSLVVRERTGTPAQTVSTIEVPLEGERLHAELERQFGDESPA